MLDTTKEAGEDITTRSFANDVIERKLGNQSHAPPERYYLAIALAKADTARSTQ